MLTPAQQQKQRLRGDTVIRVTETKGRSVKTFAITVATYVQLARLQGTFKSIELMLQAAVRKNEKDNGSTITTRREV